VRRSRLGQRRHLRSRAVLRGSHRTVEPNTFVAKEPLYDTKIAADGILDLERDKKEIRKGAKLKVVDIECEKSKLELTLEPVVGGSKVEIAFFLSIFERRDEGGKALFEKMLGYVFEEDKTRPQTAMTSS
jgi:hypothetical protein